MSHIAGASGRRVIVRSTRRVTTDVGCGRTRMSIITRIS